MDGELIIRTDLGNGLRTAGEPPPIGFELHYPATTIRGHLANSLHREAWQFLGRQKSTGNLLLRTTDASLGPDLRQQLLAMRTLIELSIRDGDDGVIIQDELLTR